MAAARIEAPRHAAREADTCASARADPAGRRTGAIDVVTRRDGREVDLTLIHRAILTAPNMRHPELAELHRSFESGQAAAALDSEGRAVGFVRLFQKLSDETYGSLGIGGRNLPQVYEIGGGYVLGSHRGKGIYTPLRNHLLGSFADAINSGRILVVGLSNNIQVISALVHSQRVGVSFGGRAYLGEFHEDYASVTPLFCNCYPRQEDDLEVKVQVKGCPHGPEGAQEPRHTWDAKGTMPQYTVYWSSRVLMDRLNGALEGRFGGRASERNEHADALRGALREIGYYS